MRFRIATLGEPVFKARKRVGELAHNLGFTDDDVDAILLAFSEALTNAVRHGSPTERKLVHVKIRIENSRLVLEVSDHGGGFRPSTIALPAPESMEEGGRGLFLMSAFMDEVQWLDSPDGTTVRLVKCCVAPAAPTSTHPTAPAPAMPLIAGH